MILDFLNKNCYRRYPFRSSSGLVSTDGRTFPDSLIASIKLTVLAADHDLFVSRASFVSNFLSVTVANYDTGEEIGTFGQKIEKNFQEIPFLSRNGTHSGFLTFGLLENNSPFEFLPGTFDRDQTRLEGSCIFVFTRPGLQKIVHSEAEANGNIVLSLENLTNAGAGEVFQFFVVNKRQIQSRGDRSGAYGNCGTPVITKINTVTPDENGNIDFYGILPIKILENPLTVPEGTISIDTDVTVPEVCPDLNKIAPPLDNVTDVYYDDVLTVESPEWKTWDQYQE